VRDRRRRKPIGDKVAAVSLGIVHRCGRRIDHAAEAPADPLGNLSSVAANRIPGRVSMRDVKADEFEMAARVAEVKSDFVEGMTACAVEGLAVLPCTLPMLLLAWTLMRGVHLMAECTRVLAHLTCYFCSNCTRIASKS